jgi:pimeloyl-ACP methyl ester carboxylesterase
MADERALLTRVEAADADELARVLAAPTEEEERALRKYLGDEHLEELHDLAQEQTVITEGIAEPRGNVVVIPGIMGSSLSSVDDRSGFDRVWLDPLYLAFRRLDLLRLSEDGRTGYEPEYDVRATGMLPFVYWRQILSLRRNWNVYPFWFDWRKDLKVSADELRTHIDTKIGEDAPVHVVGHSMGGLVTRTFLKRHADRWDTMWDQESDGRSGGRLIMLGTPNHGSFSIPLLLTGLGSVVRRLAAASLPHQLSDLLEITNSFVGTYQMLPSPHAVPSLKPLYRSKTYADLPVPKTVPQRRLDDALRHHGLLEDVVEPQRMIYVAGYGRRTINGISNFAALDSLEAYDTTETEGDGTVPHELGFLRTPEGETVTTYFVDASHTNLARDGRVLAALDELLERGTTAALNDQMPAGGLEALEASEEAAETLAAAQAAEEERVRTLAQQIRAKSMGRDAEKTIEPEEKELAEILVRGF